MIITIHLNSKMIMIINLNSNKLNNHINNIIYYYLTINHYKNKDKTN